MKLEAVDGRRIAITVAGLEWTALRIPVVRTNHPRHPREPKCEFGRWRGAGAPGRDDVIAQITGLLDHGHARSDDETSHVLTIQLAHAPGLIEVLEQNRRVEWSLPLVPRELVAQMTAAVTAFAAGDAVSPVDTERITREWNAARDDEWGRHDWQISASRLSERRARWAARVLRILRLGDFCMVDPHRSFDVRLDYSTAMHLRAALSNAEHESIVDYSDGAPTSIATAQARDEMQELLDITDFLDHAATPRPDEFD